MTTCIQRQEGKYIKECFYFLKMKSSSKGRKTYLQVRKGKICIKSGGNVKFGLVKEAS